MTDEEFRAKLFAESTQLGKIKLAIRENRVTVQQRDDKPNLPVSFLLPILDLPASHPVDTDKRKSKDKGLPQVLILKYEYCASDETFEIYVKGFFATDGQLRMYLKLQSLRSNG